MKPEEARELCELMGLRTENSTPEERRVAISAVNCRTREFLWRIYHIPLKYLMPPIPVSEDGVIDAEAEAEADRQFSVLKGQLQAKGYISLDRNRAPACLSGEPPVLPETEA